MPLTTLTDVKLALNITSAAQDDQLSTLIPSAEQVIKNYVHRDLESQTYTQIYSGTDQRHLVLRQTPVTAITSVYEDDDAYYGQGQAPVFDSTTLLTEGIDFVLDRDISTTYSKSGILWRIGYVWPKARRHYYYRTLSHEPGPPFGNIKVTYVAGFSPIPDDIKYAVAMLVRWMQRSIQFGGQQLQRERLGDYAYELGRKRLDTDFELGSLRATLAPYREIGY